MAYSIVSSLWTSSSSGDAECHFRHAHRCELDVGPLVCSVLFIVAAECFALRRKERCIADVFSRDCHGSKLLGVTDKDCWGIWVLRQCNKLDTEETDRVARQSWETAWRELLLFLVDVDLSRRPLSGIERQTRQTQRRRLVESS